MITNIPLICYASRTSLIQQGMRPSIEDDDIDGFSDLTHKVLLFSPAKKSQ